MIRPELIAFCSGDSIRNPGWTPEVCACGETITNDGMPERRVGAVVHGVLACARYVTAADAAASMGETAMRPERRAPTITLPQAMEQNARLLVLLRQCRGTIASLMATIEGRQP